MARILIVDDNFTNRQLLIEVLQDLATCEPADSGRGALELFRANPYDLVLLDIAMPEVSGLDVLRDIRALEDSQGKPVDKRIPVIMITAFKEPFVEAFKQGCTEYLTKPVDISSLLVIVRSKLKL